MVAEQRAAPTVDDPIARLALLLQQWRLKPSRDVRWLQKLCVAFYDQEPAAWERYSRVAELGSDMASFLGLSEWNAAAIRVAAFLSALSRVAPGPRPGPAGRRQEAALWEEKLWTWRWLQMATNVLHGLRPGYDDSQPLSKRGKEPPIEGQVLALVEEFDELTRDWRGAPKARIPQALKALRAGEKHDALLVDWLWSEAGQESCDRVLRGRPALDKAALAELRASVRLLEKGHPPQQTQRLEPTGRGRRSPMHAPTGKEDGGSLKEEGREVMTKAVSKEGWSIPARSEALAATQAGEEASLSGRITTVISEMEQIKLAAARSQEALASILPAMEELSALVSRLQASLQLVQGGVSTPAPSSNGGFQSIELRVEKAQGPLDTAEVLDALEGVRDLRELRVRERGTSWALLHARVDGKTDPAILEAKVTGSLSRNLTADGDEEVVNVSLRPCE